MGGAVLEGLRRGTAVAAMAMVAGNIVGYRPPFFGGKSECDVDGRTHLSITGQYRPPTMRQCGVFLWWERR